MESPPFFYEKEVCLAYQHTHVAFFGENWTTYDTFVDLFY
jgi:hypothetical protein